MKMRRQSHEVRNEMGCGCWDLSGACLRKQFVIFSVKAWRFPHLIHVVCSVCVQSFSGCNQVFVYDCTGENPESRPASLQFRVSNMSPR